MIEFYNQDCLEALRATPDKFYDLAIVDPPYSKISDWVKKAYYESFKPDTVIVLLIPARTDTRYFQEYIYHRSEIRFLKGRLHFNNSKNSAPFPSMIVIYRSGGISI